MLVTDSALGWRRGRWQSYPRPSTRLLIRECPWIMTSTGTTMFYFPKILFYLSQVVTERHSFHGRPPAHKVTSCLEISVAKGYGSLSCSWVGPCGPGTQVTQLRASILVCVQTLPIKGSITVLWDTCKVGPSHPSAAVFIATWVLAPNSLASFSPRQNDLI